MLNPIISSSNSLSRSTLVLVLTLGVGGISSGVLAANNGKTPHGGTQANPVNATDTEYNGDHDRGHGNDDDCFDEDNPGNSKGCNRGRQNKEPRDDDETVSSFLDNGNGTVTHIGNVSAYSHRKTKLRAANINPICHALVFHG